MFISTLRQGHSDSVWNTKLEYYVITFKFEIRKGFLEIRLLISVCYTFFIIYNRISENNNKPFVLRRVHLLYVATSGGLIKKISVLPRTKETCVVEVWNPSPSGTFVPIKTLRYLSDTDSVYVGLETGVLRIPTSRCQRHKTKSACHNAMDPHCGWNELLLQCTTAPDHNPLSTHWIQSVTECPLLNVAGMTQVTDSQGVNQKYFTYFFEGAAKLCFPRS